MSASEIIAEIQRLPLREQEVVFDFLQQREAAQRSKQAVRYADDAAFDKALGRVLTNNADLFRKLAK
jgi:transcriptional regulator with AAA-type ATPase domain